jgi:cytochrome c-type biogenesis protein CcmH
MTRSRRFLPLWLLAAALLVAIPALSPASAWAKKDLTHEITDGIICPCSCGEILTGCTCETGKAMKGYVELEVKGGKSKDQVEAALVSQYGEVILGAPKAQGFNLLVWVAPAVATVAGIFIATFLLTRWTRRRAVATSGGAPAGGPDAPRGSMREDAAARLAALRARAEEELRRFRG